MINQKGFTLIETLIYLFLFIIVIGGGMLAVYQIIQNTDSTYNGIILQEEANFLLRKVDWALTSATSVNIPNPITLSVQKPISGISTQISFTINGSNLSLQEGSSNPFIILNSSSVDVSAMTFIKTPGQNGEPDSITTGFTLTTAQNGRAASQHFSFTRYLSI